jgi:glycosyltransferase involved in cell wall biosynthesis
MPQPLVSCLCVTKNEIEIVKRAIDCYQAQSYPNKELIILKQGADPAMEKFILELGDSSIVFRTLPPHPILTLGELRNFSVELSKGDYFCSWDDDDWQHVNRLEIQLNGTLKNFHPSSALTNLLVFDQTTEQAYFSPIGIWEGTIMCKRELFEKGIRYPTATKGEDTAFMHLLLNGSRIFPVVSSTLYLYIYHGKNTWSLDHFRDFLFRQKLSPDVSALISNIIWDRLDVRHASALLDNSLVLHELNYFYGRPEVVSS